MRRGNIVLMAIFSLGWQAPANGTEVTVPASDGMLIDGADGVLQQVKIQLQSFGPGFCEVRVSLDGKQQVFAAPPLTWSDWFPIGPAISGGAYALQFAPQCDTGALGNVRYEK